VGPGIDDVDLRDAAIVDRVSCLVLVPEEIDIGTMSLIDEFPCMKSRESLFIDGSMRWIQKNRGSVRSHGSSTLQ
jgi:hypothetical protein